MKTLIRPCALAMATLLVASFASAQEAPPTAPTATAAMPDIVVLKDGSMLRGTIVELDKQKEVTIQLPTGKTRTIAMSEVTYAGAESGRPKEEAPKPQPVQSSPQGGTADGTVRPFVTVQGKPVTLQLSANVPEATFHLKTSSALAVGTYGAAVALGYQVICTAPCTATIPAGTHRLAVSRGEKFPQEAKDAIAVNSDSQVQARFISRAGTRTAGGVVLGGSVVAALLLMSIKTEECKEDIVTGKEECSKKLNINNFMLGTGIGIAGVVAGVMLLRVPDKLELSVTPTNSAPVARRTGESYSARSLVPDGVALTGRF